MVQRKGGGVMRSFGVVVAIASATFCAACVSNGPPEDAGGTSGASSPAPESTATAAAQQPLLYFEGSFSVATHQLDLVYRAPTGEIIDQQHLAAPESHLSPAELLRQSREIEAHQPTLPWGTGTNQVYLHTESVSTLVGNCFIQPGGGSLYGTVTPHNGYAKAISDFTAWVDTVSQSGASFYDNPSDFGVYDPVPASDDYGAVPANGVGTSGYFEICVPNWTDFTFQGHMEGTLAP
jgi:hypothetical protein